MMNIEDLRTYCISKPFVTEEFPFGPETLVFKVKGKAFLLTGIEQFKSINVKCEPELAIELRDRYQAVKPGYHMNKKHWNTIEMDDTLSDQFIYEQVNHSYQEVVKGLTKKDRMEIEKI